LCKLIDISADFIPCALATVAHVDTIEQKRKGGGVETELSILHIACFGPRERAPFQSFRQNPDSTSIPIEDLEQAAALVGEGKDGSALGILL
jgi:hypothetical protein